MVVQAQAGQRLADADPEAAQQALDAIAESARQGQDDLRRLVALLGGEEVAGPDLALIGEVVERAARSGLKVTCRFEGDHAATPPATAQLAFRVVQEALTNALRYAPGSSVHVLVRGEGAALVVRISNDGSTQAPHRHRGDRPRPGRAARAGAGDRRLAGRRTGAGRRLGGRGPAARRSEPTAQDVIRSEHPSAPCV